MSEEQSIFDCPECNSRRAIITRETPPRAQCSDCNERYSIQLTADPLPLSDAAALEQVDQVIDPRRLGRGKDKKKRLAAPGQRHRRDDGPAALEVVAVPPPTTKQLGTSHLFTYEVMQGGPRALIAAQHEAARLSAKFGEEIEAQWCLSTEWLCQLAVTHRARAQYALMWRPRFLSVVALTRSIMLGCRSARVNKGTVQSHREQDPNFDKQVIAAQEHAVELLHDVTMREAIEGHAEPVFWQGIPIGHIIKGDNRLRIEMLRAYMPEKFKTPGSKVAVNSGNTFIGVQITAVERDALVALRQEALAGIAEKMAQAHLIESTPA